MTLEEMGTYRLVMSGINLVSVLALPGAFEVLIRYVPRGKYSLYPCLFNLRIKVATLASLGFIGFSFFTFDISSTNQIVSLGLIAVMLTLYFSSQMYEAGYLVRYFFPRFNP